MKAWRRISFAKTSFQSIQKHKNHLAKTMNTLQMPFILKIIQYSTQNKRNWNEIFLLFSSFLFNVVDVEPNDLLKREIGCWFTCRAYKIFRFCKIASNIHNAYAIKSYEFSQNFISFTWLSLNACKMVCIPVKWFDVCVDSSSIFNVSTYVPHKYIAFVLITMKFNVNKIS